MDRMDTHWKHYAALAVVLAAAMLLSGCNVFQGNGAEAVVDEALADRNEPTPAPTVEEKAMCREWPQRDSNYDTLTLEHPQLYFEDPFETCGSNDGRFGLWDNDSIMSTLLSPVAFVGHVVMWPVSAVMAPPWENDTSRSREGFAEGYALPSCVSGVTAVDYPQPE